MLMVQDVVKSYPPNLVAVNHISFSITKGNFVFIVGRSGAGKTTLFRLLSKQEEPDSGVIWLNNRDITQIPRHKSYLVQRELGFVFQDFKLIHYKTVFENVAFALEVQGKSDKKIRKRTPEVLELVGLLNKRKSFPAQLSGGEQQRVAIARAIIHEPSLLIADEPTGNLDWETSNEIMTLFKTINQTGTTILMATHNEEIIQKARFRTIYLEKGKKLDEMVY
ncbi:MAG: cell division ATP-binding protein FtsE [Caldisericia bacterium]|nr:cell division ATP-binding protein FtsE [Caldisericia bacterium]